MAAFGFDRDVVEERIARCEVRIVAGIAGLFAIRNSLLGVLHDLDVGIADDDRELLLGQVEIGLALELLARLPPHLDDDDLGEKRILDEGVEIEEAWIG